MAFKLSTVPVAAVYPVNVDVPTTLILPPILTLLDITALVAVKSITLAVLAVNTLALTFSVAKVLIVNELTTLSESTLAVIANKLFENEFWKLAYALTTKLDAKAPLVIVTFAALNDAILAVFATNTFAFCVATVNEVIVPDVTIKLLNVASFNPVMLVAVKLVIVAVFAVITLVLIVELKAAICVVTKVTLA